MESKTEVPSYMYDYVNSFKDEINREELVKTGYIKDVHEPITDELVNILSSDLYKIINYMDGMKGSHVKELFETIEKEFPGINAQAPEDFRVDNNILTRHVNIPGILEFIFDIESPLFTADRQIATIYKLKYKGQDLLSKSPIQLYRSTGKSRAQLTGTDQTTDIWLPYDGRDSPTAKLKKVEDKKFGYLIEFIKEETITKSGISKIKVGNFNKLLPDFKQILKFKRFMDIDYAMSSYLASKYEYEPLPKTPEQLEEERIQADETFKLFGLFGWIKPSKHKFYYEKYMKYKQKYMELKKSINSI
jgi:hypothetical protein